jgi:hypothetical protein
MALQEAGSAAKLIDAFNNLITTLLSHYGPAGTLAIIIGAFVLAIGWRLFTDWLKNKKVDQALAEKEASIKRLAGEIRMYRAVFLKEKAGWDDDLINKFLLSDAEEAAEPAPRRRLTGRRVEND